MSNGEKIATGKRARLWALSCVAVSILFLPKFTIPTWAYLISCGLYPWAVLLFCAFMAYNKRGDLKKEVWQELQNPIEIHSIIIGVAIVIISILMPKDAGLAELFFEMLLAFFGLFVIFFWGAARYPGILLGIYGFSVGFPIILSRYLEMQYSLLTVWLVGEALKVAGFDFVAQGQAINYFSQGGREISLLVDAACAGSGSMSIFIALFALISLDVRLPRKGLFYMFILGILGTTIQNVIRIGAIVFAGVYFGPDGVVAAHNYAGYILFPLWFAAFVYIYFSYAKKLPKDA